MSDISHRLKVARTALIFKFPFFGTLALRMRLIEDHSKRTLATDGRNFYYNPDFVNKITDQELIWGFGHEIGHCIFEHFIRRDNRNPKKWNYAGDYAINLMLEKTKLGKRIEGVLYDEQYDGMSAEQIYDLLPEDYDQGEGAGGNEQFDDHMDFDNMSDEQRRELRDHMREAVLSAAASAGTEGLCDSILKLIKGLTEVKISWKDRIRSIVNSYFKSDFSWQKPNRKMMNQGFIIPGSFPEKTVRLFVAPDASGSIGQAELEKFMGVVKGICGQYTDWEITVAFWHTSVANVKKYTAFNIEDPCDAMPTESGGTDPECIFRWLEDQEEVFDAVIIPTDGEFGTTRSEFATDTYWCVAGGRKNLEHILFGEVLEIGDFDEA